MTPEQEKQLLRRMESLERGHTRLELKINGISPRPKKDESKKKAELRKQLMGIKN